MSEDPEPIGRGNWPDGFGRRIVGWIFTGETMPLSRLPEAPLTEREVETLRGLRDGTMVAVPANAIADVAAERRRQIEAEGWTPELDDDHRSGEMALAAAAYALHSGEHVSHALVWWPWSISWWKPTDRRRDLVKAAALIVAEIERLDRAAAQEPPR